MLLTPRPNRCNTRDIQDHVCSVSGFPNPKIVVERVAPTGALFGGITNSGEFALSASLITQSRGVRGAIAVFIASALAVTAGAAPAIADSSPEPPEPATVSVDPLPTVQIDGVAWTQVVVGDTVYVGGDFTTARPAGAAPGVNTVARTYILAYDIRTGELVNSFAPTLNGQVLALAASPDGSRIYAAGDFTNVNGVNKYRAVALDPTSGAVDQSFSPGFNGRARAIVATD